MSCRRELGRLQENIAEFERRAVKLWAVSASSEEDTAELAATYPGITFLADPSLEMVNTFEVRHPGGAFPIGDDRVIAYPTTFLVDRTGEIRWLYRSARIMARASIEELLAAIDIAP